MKVERFITEYANYKKRDILGNSLMQSKFKEEKTAKIDLMVRYRKIGYISIDETMEQLHKI